MAAETNSARGTDGGKPSDVDRGLSFESPLSALDPLGPSPAGAGGLSPTGSDEHDATRARDLADGFSAIGVWLKRSNDRELAGEVRQLARTFGNREGTLQFYDGLFLGLQMGVAKACVEAFEAYRAGIAEVRKAIGQVLSGEVDIIEKIIMALAEMILAVSDIKPERLVSMADEALKFAEGKANPEARALALNFAVLANQAAKIKAMFALFQKMSLVELLEGMEELVANAVLASVGELVTAMLAVRMSPTAVGEELGTWLGVLIASTLIIVVEFLLPITPPQGEPQSGQAR